LKLKFKAITNKSHHSSYVYYTHILTHTHSTRASRIIPAESHSAGAGRSVRSQSTRCEQSGLSLVVVARGPGLLTAQPGQPGAPPPPPPPATRKPRRRTPTQYTCHCGNHGNLQGCLSLSSRRRRGQGRTVTPAVRHASPWETDACHVNQLDHYLLLTDVLYCFSGLLLLFSSQVQVIWGKL